VRIKAIMEAKKYHKEETVMKDYNKKKDSSKLEYISPWAEPVAIIVSDVHLEVRYLF
jgi:hypothetical protein